MIRMLVYIDVPNPATSTAISCVYCHLKHLRWHTLWKAFESALNSTFIIVCITTRRLAHFPLLNMLTFDLNIIYLLKETRTSCCPHCQLSIRRVRSPFITPLPSTSWSSKFLHSQTKASIFINGNTCVPLLCWYNNNLRYIYDCQLAWSMFLEEAGLHNRWYLRRII